MQGVLDWISNILTTQDLPKSLMRRLPINEACEFDTSDQIGRAALVIVDSARGTGGDKNDPGRSGGVSPLLVFGGYTLLGAGAWFYFKNR